MPSTEHKSTYNSWRAMRARCNNPNDIGFHQYGGRGIKVCDRWASFELFLSDMGVRPEKHTLDRKDTDGDYTPENCRWATHSTQCKNRRLVGRYTGLEIDGVRKSFRDWEKVSPVSRAAIQRRLSAGWPPKDAVFKPEDMGSGGRRFSDSDRVAMRESFAGGETLASIARRFEADPSTVWRIVH